ncbi:MAG: RNA methyltransferase [Oligoflexia bacterium]|nr:RNA methyltransferase [Oligoflexia bacterium]MBF0366808.1 RNA methyltransferase [Oligoflexia bacterium]
MKERKANIYLGLVHGPVKNKYGKEVTTSVTNLDVHDIARSCRTFGFKGYFIITPVWAQHDLLGKMLGYWESDSANLYNPDRHDALKLIKLVNTIEESVCAIREREEGRDVLVAVTGANFQEDDGLVEAHELMEAVAEANGRPLLLLFGTGHGLVSSIVESADYRLTPIVGLAEDGYNHLSVRSAVAIYCERLACAQRNSDK